MQDSLSISNSRIMTTKYRSLIIKVVVFLAVLAGIDFVVGKAYRSLEHKALAHSPYGMVTEYTMWEVHSDVVIIGASEAQHSYIPSVLEEKLGLSVYNCGKDGCRFYYQNAMINGILDRYTPKMLIWSISPDELSTPSEQDKGKLSELNPFYKSNKYCKEVLKTKSDFELLKLKSNCYLYNSKLFQYLYCCYYPDYQYEKGYAPLYGNQKGLEIKTKTWNDNYDETIDNVFSNTLQRCVQNNVQIVLVYTPRLETGDYSVLESQQHLRSTINNVGVLLIDDLYHNDSLMLPEYFKDNAHLNHEGAALFTGMLAEKIVSAK